MRRQIQPMRIDAAGHQSMTIEQAQPVDIRRRHAACFRRQIEHGEQGFVPVPARQHQHRLVAVVHVHVTEQQRRMPSPPVQESPQTRQRRIDAAALLAQLNALAPKLLPYTEPVWQRLAELRRRGARILFEGAQGAMLDVDHGTYPFVTSSNTLAAAAALGAGTGPDAVGYVLGITKAYTTRVGSGPI